MEDQRPVEQDNQPYEPNMFWEGFYYLSFFIFFNIVLIPYTPKSWSFDRYYPIALITYGFAGVLCGIFAFRLVKNAPGWLKFAIMAVLYGIMLFYLFDNVHRFTAPVH